MSKKNLALQQTSPLYVPADFYMLRTPVLPADVFSQVTAMATNPTSIEEESLDRILTEESDRGYAALRQLASQPLIEQALAIASLSLLEGLSRIRSGEQTTRVQRAYSRLLRYIVRMSTRPTPFGLFAGVALGTFADETTASLGTHSIGQIRTRPDMDWLLSVLQKVEESPELVAQLFVSANQTVYIVGGRALLPYADTYGKHDDRSISLRATPVVRFVLDRARQPIHYADLRTELLKAFPQAREQQVDKLLWQLWEHHFLISDLHPPLTSAKPAHYILEHLSRLNHTETITTSLREILQKTAELDQIGAEGPIALIQDLEHCQQQLVPSGKEQRLQLQIDTALHLASPSLNRAIGQAAAQAATTLLRQTPLPEGYSSLQEYRLAFIEHYGENAEVPVLDLLSPERGLDAPPSYTQPPRTSPLRPSMQPPDTSRRDRALLGLVTEAVNNRALEVELTDSLLGEIERWSPKVEDAPFSLEIYMQVCAESHTALDQGRWQAVMSLNCGSPAAGRTFGRFMDLTDSEGIEALQRLIQREEMLSSDAIFAEVSYMPGEARAANVALRPLVRSYEITVGTTPSVPPDKVIRLSDLVVGLHNSRFYLRSLSLGKQVIVRQGHMLNMMTAPNVCRFITEIAQDGRPALSSFDWGAVAASPFLPRLVQKQVVLSPAQWNLTRDTIVPTGTGSEEARWFTGLQRWRKQWRVPRYVYMTEADNRLLLDLEHPLLVAELRKELTEMKGVGSIALQELLPDFDHLWLRDSRDARYFSEIVVPLLRADVEQQEPVQIKNSKQFQPPRVISQEERSAFPGDTWVYFKLYTSSRQHDEIIAGPMRDITKMLQEQGVIDQWFYIRYTDPQPHLRLRLHAKETESVIPLLAAMLKWSRQQVERGSISRFSIETYEREIERYGGPLAIDAIEQLFHIDSVITSDIIAAQYANHLTLDSLAVAVFSLDHFLAAWGLDFDSRLSWIRDSTDKNEAHKEFRSQRRLLCELLMPWNQKPAPDITAQREQLLALFSPREARLREISTQIRSLAAANKLWVREEELLRSLSHMHINRLLGIDHWRERRVYAFWRHTLESLRLRPASIQLVQE